MRAVVKSLILGFLAFAAASGTAEAATDREPTIAERAAALGPGQYVWDTQGASGGPVFLTIDLTSQRAALYRDGALIAVS